MSQTALQETLPFLKKALDDNGGGHIEKATAEANLALSDIDQAIAYVHAHPEVNALLPGPAPAEEFNKIRPADFPPYIRPADGAGRRFVYYVAMAQALESLNKAVNAFMNVPESNFRGYILGNIGGFRSTIAGDIMKASAEVLAALDYAHQQDLNSGSAPKA